MIAEAADLAPWMIAALALTGFVAGFIDSIAGGGGMIALPALLLAGIPTPMALGTLKLQASFGAFSAAFTFLRRGAVSLRRMRFVIGVAFLLSGCGALVAQIINPVILAKIIPILLIGIALYLVVGKKVGEVAQQPRLNTFVFQLLFGVLLGFYDGFFGPGTGTFWALAFVLLQGEHLVNATAQTKIVNFASNFGALITFILGGKVLWMIGIIMGIGQLLGARLGATLVLRQGAGLVRPLLATASIAVTLRLLWQDPHSWLHGLLAFLFSQAQGYF